MTTRDYDIIGAVIQEMRCHSVTWNSLLAQDVTARMARQVATVFEDRDDKFDRYRFLRTCGLEG